MHVWRERALVHLRDVKITSTCVVCPKSCLKSHTEEEADTKKNVPMSVSNG